MHVSSTDPNTARAAIGRWHCIRRRCPNPAGRHDPQPPRSDTTHRASRARRLPEQVLAAISAPPVPLRRAPPSLAFEGAASATGDAIAALQNVNLVLASKTRIVCPVHLQSDASCGSSRTKRIARRDGFFLPGSRECDRKASQVRGIRITRTCHRTFGPGRATQRDKQEEDGDNIMKFQESSFLRRVTVANGF